MDVERVEAGYLELALRDVGSSADGIELVLPDRLPPPVDAGSTLVGWWVDERVADGRVVLPNPYDSVETISAMEAWVWSVAQRVAPRLGEVLDDLAGRAARPGAYWRTLLLPWLVHLLSALADRRLFCRAAATMAPTRPVLVPGVPPPPATTADAINRLRTDAGNAGLIAVLAPLLRLPSARAETHPTERHRVDDGGQPRPPRRELVRQVPRVLSAGALARLPARRVALVGLTPLTALELARLEARVPGLAPLPRRTLGSSAQPGAAADRGARVTLAAPNASDPLERLAFDAMPDLLPRSLLEDFDAVERESRRRYGRPVNALVGNYSVDEVQNEFLARCRIAGRSLAFSQHGGMYLQSPVNAQERLEIEPGSVFLSWGGRGPNVVPTPNPYLERLRNTHRGGSRITIVEALEPPDVYLLRFAGHPQANQAYETARMAAELVQLLPAALRACLVLKRFPSPIGRPARPQPLEDLPSDGPPGGASAWMAGSRLAVIPYLDTPFIEAIVIGTPTVGLWNPARWPLLPELRDLFVRLSAVGVVHSYPARAAAHIEAVYDDVERWWGRDDVVQARSEFIERFGIPGDWLHAWSTRLRDLTR